MANISFKVDLSVYEKGKKAPQFGIGKDLEGEVSLKDFLEYIQDVMIKIAVETLREEQARGFEKDPVVTVDGRRNKTVAQVIPFGTIQFTAKIAALDLIVETYKAIEARSPKVTGTYLKGNLVFLNGKKVASSLLELEAWIKTNPDLGERDLIRFVNILPYARKMERLAITRGGGNARFVKSRDKQKRSGNFVLAPNGAYFLAFRSVSRKYKRNTRIKFGFVAGYELQGLASNVPANPYGKKWRHTFKRDGRAYLYPSISVYVSGGGFK